MEDLKIRTGIFAVLGKLLREFFREKRGLFLLFSLSILTALLDLTVPLIIQRTVDTFVRSIRDRFDLSPTFLVYSAVAIFLVTIIGRTLRNIYDYRLFQKVTKLEDNFRRSAYAKYLNLHALYHYSQSSGQIIGRIERGAVGIYAIINDIVGQQLFVPTITVVVVMAILLSKSLLVAAITCLPIPFYILVVRNLSEKIYKIDREAFDCFDAASHKEYDTASNVLTVKRFGQEEREIEEQKALRDHARDVQYLAERLWSKMDILQTGAGSLGRVTVFVVAGLEVMLLWGKATIGEFILYLTLQNMVYQPMFSLSFLFPRLRRNIARVERMFEILDTPAEIIDRPDAKKLLALEKEINFKNVWFRYGENLPPALKSVSVNLPRGFVTALVGRSGGGKTTFVNLLMRAYDPTSGAISIDGVDIRTVNQKSLRDQIAIVPQEVDLFSRSVKENIRYGKPDATDAEVKEAARLALADGFIEKLENGYDTVVGERGVKLSGGQRQRVGIARAIIKNPSILIFDEATSHLDTESERLIREAMESVTKNRTTIIIAHRLSTVLRAHQIIVFDHGNIEAVGRHEELLEKSPTYKKLYELQFEN